MTNIPNTLSWGRILLIPLVVVLLIFPSTLTSILSCFVIIAAGITDIFDGILARKYQSVSTLGKFLDPLADKLLVVSVLIMLVYLDRISSLGPIFTIIVVLLTGREIFITGLRAIARDKGMVIAAGQMGKYKTSLQMFAIGLLVLPQRVFELEVHQIGFVLLLLSLFFSIYSAYEYISQFMKQIYKTA